MTPRTKSQALSNATKLALTEQECPNVGTALKRAERSLLHHHPSADGARSSAGSCSCPHLREFLPHKLDLHFCQNPTGDWVLKNPIHALHLVSSQWDEDDDLTDSDEWHTSSTSQSSSSSLLYKRMISNNASTPVAGNQPIIYGQEQERTMALWTRGFSDQWHPYTHDFATLHQKEQQQQQQQQLVAAAANDVTTTTATTTTTTSSKPHRRRPSLATKTTSSSSTTTTTTGDPKSSSSLPVVVPPSSQHHQLVVVVPAEASSLSATTKPFAVTFVEHSLSTATTATPTPSATVPSDPAPPNVDTVPSSESTLAPTAAATSAATTTMPVQPSMEKEPDPPAVPSKPLSTDTLPPQPLETREPSEPVATPTRTKSAEQPGSSDATRPLANHPPTKQPDPNAADPVVVPGSTGTAESVEPPPPALPVSSSSPTAVDPLVVKVEDKDTMATPPSAAATVTSGTADVVNNNNDDTSAVPLPITQPNVVPQGTDLAAVTSSCTTTVTATTAPASTAPAAHQEEVESDEPHLDEARFWSLQSREAHIGQLRRTFLSTKRNMDKQHATTTSSSSSNKKRKSETKPLFLSQMSAWKEHSPPASYRMSTREEQEWYRASRVADTTVKRWLQHYRTCREAYWQDKLDAHVNQTSGGGGGGVVSFTNYVFGALEPAQPDATVRTCLSCCQTSRDPNDTNRCWWDGTTCPMATTTTKTAQKRSNAASYCDGDDLMQCLECSFIGCGPCSVSRSESTREHILEHHLMSNHMFAVTCGPRASVYCFRCADFVYHDIFDQEKERIDLNYKLPWMAWKEVPMQRSFDALQFLQVPDQGIFWSGMHAAFVSPIPAAHLRAAHASRWRQMVFHGEMDELPLTTRRAVLDFCVSQSRLAPSERWKIPAPVGMYNLGNTCFQSAVLQCLIACRPIQKYFLHDIMHHHVSCAQYRESTGSKDAPRRSNSSSSTKSSPSKKPLIRSCLACELDKLMLQYLGSARGLDIFSAVMNEEDCAAAANKSHLTENAVQQGDPLITTEMLTSAWKCGGMNHLAGYDQRDAHEFLHGFLDNMGKHDREYQSRIAHAIGFARDEPASGTDAEGKKSVRHDIVRSLFEGTFRSVLVCQQCGNKRAQSESFMSISLDLTKEVQLATAGNSVLGASSPPPNHHRTRLAVDRCLQHFTMPETLVDPVDCPSCGTKTLTKKQNVISKLPRVLCLHLKRFDAAHNRKVEDFVAFPEKNLNMGAYLPHWCEVPQAPTNPSSPKQTDASGAGFVPDILYDLFATVNHFGSMQSGHYMANIKSGANGGKWYHCNDAHVSQHQDGNNGARQVLAADGAYLLFYIRK